MIDAAPRKSALDTSVFAIETQTSERDRLALLRVQSLVRRSRGWYAYLEIGSHLGGTLLPHLLDPACVAVHSVDPRPPRQPDARGTVFDYDDNSTQRMRGLLAAVVPPERLQRLTTWEHDAAAVPAHGYGRRFDLALIDGEHTNTAAFSDFLSIFPVLQRDACVMFHDANLITDAIANAERFLRYERTAHVTLFMPDQVAVVCLRGLVAPAVAELAAYAVDRAAYEAYASRELIRQLVENSRAGEDTRQGTASSR